MASPISEQDRLAIALALKRREELVLRECFDPANPDSLPTGPQLEVIKDFGHIKNQWIVAGNQSGKSQTCSRIVAWFLEESHPFWTRPKAWGNEPLLILVAGRTGKQIEESLAHKILSYLPKGTYKEIRIGNILQKIEHINGNRIIFQSMENPETARERVQSYVAHLVWIDEMPPTTSLITELQVRTNSRDGYFMASFTPLVENMEIQKMVDGATLPTAKKYIFKMFDNPLYSSIEKQQAILETMRGLPDTVVKTRLFGEWSQSQRSVYFFDQRTMVEAPLDYSPMWRHVEASDPAVQSKFGFTIWAEHPVTGIWYCVRDEYIEGIFVPEKILDEVLKRTSGLNIVRRICDPHEAWYIHTASARGIIYLTPYDKNSRKGELIKNLQQGLGTKAKLAPWCTRLQEEFTNCKWADGNEKIVNASSFHLLDCAQYFMDCKPPYEGKNVTQPWWEELRLGNQQRKVVETLKQNARLKVGNRSKFHRRGL